MSLVFTHYDRTHACNHTGMLGRQAEDGSRMCARCGRIVRAEADRLAAVPGATDRARRARRAG